VGGPHPAPAGHGGAPQILLHPRVGPGAEEEEGGAVVVVAVVVVLVAGGNVELGDGVVGAAAAGQGDEASVFYAGDAGLALTTVPVGDANDGGGDGLPRSGAAEEVTRDEDDARRVAI